MDISVLKNEIVLHPQNKNSTKGNAINKKLNYMA
jgi:hypothetical protein